MARNSKNRPHTKFRRPAGPPTKITPGTSAPPSLPEHAFLIELCTHIWRVEKRITALANRGEDADVERLLWRFEELKDLLGEQALETREYTGQRYDPGMTLTVLTYVPDAKVEVGREVVLETIRPTIYRQGILLSAGEIVVGIPVPAAQELPDAVEGDAVPAVLSNAQTDGPSSSRADALTLPPALSGTGAVGESGSVEGISATLSERD